MMKCKIRCHMQQTAYRHIKGRDVATGVELVPGQVLAAGRGRDADLGGPAADGTFVARMAAGWVQIPAGTWRPDVTARAFVEAWERSKSVREVAARLGRSPKQVMAWERRLRRAGVQLGRL